MRNYAEFYYDFLFGDHFGKLSNEALIYYIALNFYADNGFVANPMRVLDSLGFAKVTFDELVANGEIIVQADRSEVFITAYYLHNKGFKPASWLGSPFAPYWIGKLTTKTNRIAKFYPGGIPNKNKKDPIEVIEEPSDDAIKWDAVNTRRALALHQQDKEGQIPLTEEEQEFLNEWNKVCNK